MRKQILGYKMVRASLRTKIVYAQEFFNLQNNARMQCAQKWFMRRLPLFNKMMRASQRTNVGYAHNRRNLQNYAPICLVG